MTRVLVCGGRDFANKILLYHMLDEIHRQRSFSVVIHGAAKGADTLAATWAKDRNIPTEDYPADWEKHGKSAGPRRNLKMLYEGRPDLIVAFPGGRGTSHMKQISKAHGVQVVEIPDI